MTPGLDDDIRAESIFYLKTGEKWIEQYAAVKLAASVMAAKSLFGPSWQTMPGASLLFYGIDLKPFDVPVKREENRAALNLVADDFVVGHVGRFVPQKNHDLLLRIHQELLKLEPKTKLLLLGKGPLEEPVRATAQALGLSSSIRFAGVRDDVPQLMLGAMDVFALPSIYEGLGLVAIEAQAAGLPTILSSSVPPEADLGGGLVQFVSPKRPLAIGLLPFSISIAKSLPAILMTRSNSSRSLLSLLNTAPRICVTPICKACPRRPSPMPPTKAASRR